MSNNLPLYPLLRRDRNVDVIVCFDASADIKQENWLSVAEDYAKERNVRGWPVGAGWPRAKDETKRELDAADAVTAQQAAGKIAETREEQRGQSPKTAIGYCNGTHISKQLPPSMYRHSSIKRFFGSSFPSALPVRHNAYFDSKDRDRKADLVIYFQFGLATP